MTAALSTALTMSTTARPATDTAVSASISTPVRSVVRTVAVISTASSTTDRSTATDESASGWHNGTRSEVRLAAMIPATRATPSASPLGTPSPRSSSTTAAETSTRPDATASRAVRSLADTSTMRAAPVSSTWVSSPLRRHGQKSRSSTSTCTWLSVATSVASAGTTIRALASARSPIRCEPCPPTGTTWAPRPSIPNLPRTNC